ncbi:alpha/beta fold hydrolase [Reinekea sp. G2M2-21]|uniref:alpha/beta fold hydrolase n=1 Tax=Reinekea sp. G2M2-21 TaxID=2788942 RepID=UPI0018AC1B21|nr:alpha/beta hydrolase [Reinekea sp. G2M2-21]
MIEEMEFRGKKYLYEIYGHGDFPPLVYIGGAFQTISNLRPISQGLQAFGSVVVLDLPGFGNADLLEAGYCFDFYTDLLIDFFRRKQLNRVGLVGASYGSVIANQFACFAPDMVESLVLAGTMKSIPSCQKPIIQESIRQLEDGCIGDFAQTAVRVLMNHDHCDRIIRFQEIKKMMIRSLRRLTIQDQQKYIQNTKRLLKLDNTRVTAPTCQSLLFTGEYDTFTTPGYCFELAEDFTNARIVTVDSSDHLVHLQQLHTAVNLCASVHYSIPLSSIPNIKEITRAKAEAKAD